MSQLNNQMHFRLKRTPFMLRLLEMYKPLYLFQHIQKLSHISKHHLQKQDKNKIKLVGVVTYI